MRKVESGERSFMSTSTSLDHRLANGGRVNQLTSRKSLLSLFVVVAPRHPGLDCTFKHR